MHSLRGALPFPHTAPPGLKEDVPRSSADDFAEAFKNAQVAIAHRARLVWLWPWYELWGSRTARPMREVDRYLKPIIERALLVSREAREQGGGGGGEKEVGEGETLLDHLAKYTSGACFFALRRCVWGLRACG